MARRTFDVVQPNHSVGADRQSDRQIDRQIGGMDHGISGLAVAEDVAAPEADAELRPAFHEVQLTAYLRWLREGGDDASNWAAAEAELTQKLRQQRGL